MAARSVLVTPIAPDCTGNGLAMRAGMWLEALAAVGSVDVVVVPVAGGGRPGAWARDLASRVTVVPAMSERDAQAHAVRAVGDAALRGKLAATAPLPLLAAAAAATLADDVEVDRGERPDAVVVLRLYLAPFGLRLASRLGGARVVVDVDDDDEAVFGALGATEEGAAFGRLARAWLPDATVVTAASPVDAAALAARHGIPVETVPNAVRAAPDVGDAPGLDRLLFVGNLTYAPNLAAATVLVEEVLPLLRERRPAATVALVGAVDAHARRLEQPGVHVVGSVDDLAPSYAHSDVVVVPLRVGGGTRLKVLEAFSYGRPVVATAVAVAGLDVTDDRDVVIADAAADLAHAVDALLADPARAARLVQAGRATWANRYAPQVVGPVARRAAFGHGMDGETGARR